MSVNRLGRHLLVTLSLLLLSATSGQSLGGNLPLVFAARLVNQRRAVAKRRRQCPKPREVIPRADGGWAASTLNGYVLHGSNATYKKNFRVTRHTFCTLLDQLRSGGYCRDNKSNDPAKRQTGRFKLAVCLYFFGQGTGWKAADYDHKTLTRMVYASMILHNACTVHKDDAVEFDVGSDSEWLTFFEEFASHRCPSCKARHAAHCSHDANNRNPGRWPAVNGAAHEQREKIKRMLWERDYGDEAMAAATHMVFQSDYRVQA